MRYRSRRIVSIVGVLAVALGAAAASAQGQRDDATNGRQSLTFRLNGSEEAVSLAVPRGWNVGERFGNRRELSKVETDAHPIRPI